MTSPWALTTVTAGGFAVGLLVIQGGIKPERKTFARSEAARRWGLLTAVAIAQACGVTVGLLGVWSKNAWKNQPRVGVLTGLVLLLLVGALVAFVAYRMRSHRSAAFSFPNTDDYPIRRFRLRQALVILAFALPSSLALSGAAAVAASAQTLVANAGNARRSDVQTLLELRTDFASFMTAAAVEVIAIVILVTVAQSALKLGLPPTSQSHLRPGDPFVLGVILSLAMAAVILPSYLLLQDSGRRLGEAILKGKPLDNHWFQLHDQVQSVLAPTPFGSTALVSAVLAVFSPIITVAVTDIVGSWRDRPRASSAAPPP